MGLILLRKKMIWDICQYNTSLQDPDSWVIFMFLSPIWKSKIHQSSIGSIKPISDNDDTSMFTIYCWSSDIETSVRDIKYDVSLYNTDERHLVKIVYFEYKFFLSESYFNENPSEKCHTFHGETVLSIVRAHCNDGMTDMHSSESPKRNNL